jgi:hypothetical protein
MNILRALKPASADATANSWLNEVVGNKSDAAAAVGTTKSLMAYAKQAVTHGLTNVGYGVQQRKCVLKADGSVLNGADSLYTISGGPIYARIFGIVTTVIGGAANGTLNITTTTPSGTTALSTTVAIDSDAAGTLYSFNTVAAGTVPVLTPTTAGALWFNEATATFNSAFYFLPPGTVVFTCSAARTGVIAWYLEYLPLSPATVVVAAA